MMSNLTKDGWKEDSLLESGLMLLLTDGLEKKNLLLQGEGLN